MVRWNRLGELEYVGRSDFQVKVRGFRIESGEIEAVLRGLAGVQTAAVVVYQDEDIPDILVAYVVPSEGPDVDVDLLRTHLTSALPEYMVPTAIEVLEALPLTHNGKLNRRALPRPALTGDQPFRAPRSKVESTIAEVYSELLRVSQVGIDDSFFALGGDSIMSIQLVSRCKARGISFSPRDVFQHPTIARLAEVAVQHDGKEPEPLEELDGGGVGWMPLVPFVRRIVEADSESRDVHIAAVSLPESIDRSGIVSTLSALIDHHDVLRSTVVHEESTGWGVEVAEPGSVDVAGLVRQVPLSADLEFESLRHQASLELEATLDATAGSNAGTIRSIWFDFGSRGQGFSFSWSAGPSSTRRHWRCCCRSWDPCGRTSSQCGPRSSRSWEPRCVAGHALFDDARSVERIAELPRWVEELHDPEPLLGLRAFDRLLDHPSTFQDASISVPADMAHSLLLTLPHVFHCRVNDGILAAAAMAVARFHQDRGVEHRKILVRREIDGRDEAVVPGSDVSRTVGQFGSRFRSASTCRMPNRRGVPKRSCRRACGQVGQGGAARRPGQRDRLRAAALLNPDTATQLSQYPEAQISFGAFSSLTKASLGSDQRVSGGRQRPRRTLCSGPMYSALPRADLSTSCPP